MRLLECGFLPGRRHGEYYFLKPLRMISPTISTFSARMFYKVEGIERHIENIKMPGRRHRESHLENVEAFYKAEAARSMFY